MTPEEIKAVLALVRAVRRVQRGKGQLTDLLVPAAVVRAMLPRPPRVLTKAARDAELEEFLEELAEQNPEARLFDGLEDALVGYGSQYPQPALAIYDREKAIQLLVRRDGMSYEAAAEFFDFNTAQAYVGEGTPIILAPRRKT